MYTPSQQYSYMYIYTELVMENPSNVARIDEVTNTNMVLHRKRARGVAQPMVTAASYNTHS